MFEKCNVPGTLGGDYNAISRIASSTTGDSQTIELAQQVIGKGFWGFEAFRQRYPNIIPQSLLSILQEQEA